MKISQIENLLVDYKTSLAIKQESKAFIINDAAERGAVIDLELLENDTANDLEKLTSLKEFFKDSEINL